MTHVRFSLSLGGRGRGWGYGIGFVSDPHPDTLRVSTLPHKGEGKDRRKAGRDKKEPRVALAAAFWLYPRAFPVGVKRPQSGHPRRSCAGGGGFSACHINRS